MDKRGGLLTEHREFVLLFIIMAFALDFRMMLLGLHRLQQDECLYSAYAVRMVTHGDISMNGGLGVDKPPLYFYSIALSFLVNGISENSARLTNIIFSLIMIFYIYKLAGQIYKDRLTPLLSAFFAAFSVIFTLFSVTAFQDISMTALMVISFYYIKQKDHFRSALFYAMSIACKPMTLFILPVYLALIFMEEPPGILLKKSGEYIKAFVFVFIPLFLWSAFLANPRWGMFTFFIRQQPEAIGAASNITERFITWLKYSEFLLNNYVFLAIAAAGLAVSCVSGFFRVDKEAMKYDWFFLLSIFFIYMLFSSLKFRQFDRYVVILVPFAAIALARAISAGAGLIKNEKARFTAAALAAFIYILPMRGLPHSGIKMGALWDGADGFERAAGYVRQASGPGTQLIYFGDSLSWYGFFYLPDVKFHNLTSVFGLDGVKKAAGDFNGRNLIVLDAGQRSKDEVDFMKKNYKLVYSAEDTGAQKEKYLVFEKGGN